MENTQFTLGCTLCMYSENLEIGFKKGRNGAYSVSGTFQSNATNQRELEHDIANFFSKIAKGIKKDWEEGEIADKDT